MQGAMDIISSQWRVKGYYMGRLYDGHRSSCNSVKGVGCMGAMGIVHHVIASYNKNLQKNWLLTNNPRKYFMAR